MPHFRRKLRVLLAGMLLLQCVTGPADAPVQLCVAFPHGGERFFVGDTCRVVAQTLSRDPGVAGFSFFLSTDNGKRFYPLDSCILAGIGPETFTWTWVVRESLTVGPAHVSTLSESCFVKIAAEGISDTSRGAFSLRRLPVSSAADQNPVLLYPDGGEVYGTGDTMEVRVRSRPDIYPIQPVFALSIDNGRSWHELDQTPGLVLTSRDTTLRIDVPDSIPFTAWDPGLAQIVTRNRSVISDSCRFRIRDYVPETQCIDVSDGVFTIR